MAKARADESLPSLKWPKAAARAVGGRYVYMCDLLNILTLQLLPPPSELEITSASYGNCPIYLLSNCPTQREDACLLKGPELDVQVAQPAVIMKTCPELKTSARLHSDLRQQTCVFSANRQRNV